MSALDHVMPRALEHLLGPEWKQRLRETVRTFMAGTTPGDLRRAEVRARRSAAAAEANKKRWAAHNAEKARLAAEGGSAKPLPVWTVERDNMLARDWPAGVHTDVLWPALNALPGPPIRSVQGIKQRAVALKLKREVSSPETAERRRAAILKANAARLAKHTAERHAAPAQPAPLSPAEAEWPWTPERDAALLEWGATTQDDALLLEVMNALPGPRVDSRAAIRTRLDWLGYQAQDAAQAAEAAQEGLADAVAEATPAAEAQPAQPPTAAHDVGDDARRERARENRRAAMQRANAARWEAHRAEQARLAAEATPEPPRPVTRTPERLALLSRDYPAGVHLDRLLAAVNALPGPPVANVEALRRWALEVGLRRQQMGEEQRQNRRAAMQRANAARHARRAAAAAIAATAAQAPDQVTEDLARTDYGPPAAVEPEAEPAAEPEAPAPAPEPEPAEEAAPTRTIQPPLKVATPAPQPRSLKATTPWIAAAIAPVAATLSPWASTNPHRLTEEAEAEALAMLRDDKGAKALHEHFGGRLDWWQRWAGEKRQEGRVA